MKETLRPLTRKEYNSQTPKNQGYISYMSAAWNKKIPNECPYRKNTKEYDKWNEGNFQAMLDCQDSEE